MDVNVTLVVSVSCGCVTNYYKLGGLKNQKFILSQFWRPEVWNQCHWVKIKVSAGPSRSGGFRGGFIPCLFQLLVAAGLPCRGYITPISASVFTSSTMSLSNLCLPLSYKNVCDGGFPGGAMVNNPPANAGDRFEPWSRKIPHAAEQLSPCTTTTEPTL